MTTAAEAIVAPLCPDCGLRARMWVAEDFEEETGPWYWSKACRQCTEAELTAATKACVDATERALALPSVRFDRASIDALVPEWAPCVYRIWYMWEGDEYVDERRSPRWRHGLLYVGGTLSPRKRLKDHLRRFSLEEIDADFVTLQFLKASSDIAKVEARAIRVEWPEMNVAGVDQSYSPHRGWDDEV